MRKIDSSLSQLLKTLRAEAGITQEELAERAGISVRTISDAERGLRATLYKDTIERVADALDLHGTARSEFSSVARRKPRLEPRKSFRPDATLSPTPLIGREAEVEEIAQLLISGQTPILTITGPGGVGKTRVAVEAASRAQEHFDSGVFFVSLAAVSDSASVLNTMARVIGLVESRESLEESLIDTLREKRALLLLDTFEHVVDAASSLSRVSGSCSELVLLITSRVGLRLRGEKQVALAPLELPPPSSEIAEAESIEGYPAVSLFLDRARAIGQEFEIDEDSTEVLSDICRRLDGLPLAIELAAVRLKHLPLKTLRDHLHDRLSILRGGARDLPDRQRTMADTIAWSYDLLSPEGQRFFRELSVFSGGWTLEAAEAICTLPVSGSALELSSELLDHSLLQLTKDPSASPRYSMLDTIMEYSASLQPDGVGHRHANYFLALAESAESQTAGSLQPDWFSRLVADEDNLHGAFDWMANHGDAESCLRMAGALWQFWRLRGEFTLGRARMDVALEMAGGKDSPALGKALWGAAWLCYHHADFEEARRRGEMLSQWADKTDDAMGRRNALTIIGKIETAYRRHESAMGPLREALAIAKEIRGGDWHLATSYLNLGMAVLLVRGHDEAEKLLEEARSRYGALGDTHFVGTSTGYLAYSALRKGDRSKALRLFQESLSMFGLEDRWGIAESLDRLAAFYSMDADLETAAVLAGAANELRTIMGLRRMPEDSTMIEEPIARAREELGEDWESLFQSGSELPIEEVIDLALGGHH